jgi:PAS domain S-box-containing protein
VTRVAPKRSLRAYLSALLLLFVGTELIGAGYVFSRVANVVVIDIAVYSLLLLVLLIAAMWLYRSVTFPLSELARSVRADASSGRLLPLSVTGPKEIAELVEDINGLINTVAGQLADRERAEVRARATLDASLDAMVSMDEDGAIVEWNRQAQLTFGWTRAEVMGKVFAQLIIPETYRAQHTEGLAQLLRTGEAPALDKSVELEALAKDGREFPVELSIMPTRTPLGQIFSASIRDLSERRDAESAQADLEGKLRQAQRLETVGQLAGGLAHDFNNLLAVILNYAEFVAEQLPEGEMRQDVEEIQRAATRGADLTRQLLIFARREVNRPELLDVNDVLSGVENVLRRTLGEQVEFVKSLAAELPAVRVDPGQLEQVFLNLAVNARDAMPGGGRLLVETALVDPEDVDADVVDRAGIGPHVRFSVSDSGTGMTKDVVARAFEPFFTTKPAGQGTGLGLATVYGIVTQAGGTIRLQSEPGKGTLVAISLPAVYEPTTLRRSSLPVTALKGRGETVLIVEDEAPVLLATIRMLSTNDYTVFSRALPSDALALLADEGRRVDVLLTDVVMPLMSGPELARRARAIRPRLKVLYMSGYSGEMISRHGALKAGSRLVQKPFTKAALLNALRQTLDSEIPDDEALDAFEPRSLLDPTA